MASGLRPFVYPLIYGFTQVGSLADPLVDIEVELPAHIEAEAVAVARLVVEVYEGDADRVGSLRVEGHPVGPAVLRVLQQLVQTFPGGELGLNLVHLLPSSLRRHLGKQHLLTLNSFLTNIFHIYTMCFLKIL